MKTVAGRRQFLKNMAVLGAGIYLMPFVGAAHDKRPLTVVLSDNVRNPGFLSSVAHSSPIEVRPVSVLQPQHWGAFIQQHRGQRLIGLMDNASYVVFEAVLADQGARFLVSGHHAHGHRFITLPETAGVAATLDKYLSTTQAGYQLEEICRGAPKATTTVPWADAYQGKSDWASVTGACYVRIANGDWSAGLPGNFSRSGSKSAAAADALVSFVVKV